jgi:hypothetical protein
MCTHSKQFKYFFDHSPSHPLTVAVIKSYTFSATKVSDEKLRHE